MKRVDRLRQLFFAVATVVRRTRPGAGGRDGGLATSGDFNLAI